MEIFSLTITKFLLSVFTGAKKQSLADVQASQDQGVASPQQRFLPDKLPH